MPQNKHTLITDTIAEGICFSRVSDEKFKSSRISVNLIVPLEKESASVNAILPLRWQKGCSTYPDFTMLNRHLDDMYGAALYGDVMKFGGYQILSLSVSGLADRYTMEKRRLVSEYADLLCDLILEPKITDGAFDENDIKTEKLNLLDSIDSEINDKRTYAVGRCLSAMYEGTNNAVRKLGERSDAEKITPVSAAEAYRKVIDSAFIEVMFVGCDGADDAFEVFSRRFGSLKRSPIQYDPMPPAVPERPVRHISESMDVTQGKLVIAFRPKAGLSVREALTCRVMSAMFGGTAFSLLFKEVREKLSLCYYCSSRCNRGTGTLVVDSGVEFENTEAAEAEILRQFERIKSGDFDDEDLEHTVLAMINSLRGVGDSLSSTESWYTSQRLTGEKLSPEDEIEMISAVTREDIIEAAKGFKPDTVFLLKGEDDDA